MSPGTAELLQAIADRGLRLGIGTSGKLTLIGPRKAQPLANDTLRLAVREFRGELLEATGLKETAQEPAVKSEPKPDPPAESEWIPAPGDGVTLERLNGLDETARAYSEHSRAKLEADKP